VKNSAKVTLLSYNTTAVFLHDVMVSENDVLKMWQWLYNLAMAVLNKVMQRNYH